MTQMKTKAVMVMVILVMAMGLCACGSNKTDKYVGTYFGEQGSVLILAEDGTCKYSDKGDSSEGTWSVEDHVLTVTGCSSLKCDIYAEIDDTTSALFFEADDDALWLDELLVKTQ